MPRKLRIHSRVGIAVGIIAAITMLPALASCGGCAHELNQAELLSEDLGTPINLSDIDAAPSLSSLTDGLYDVLLDDFNNNEQLRFTYAPYGDNYSFFAFRTLDSVYYSVFAFEPGAIDPAHAPVTQRGISLGADSLTVVNAYGNPTEATRANRLEILFYVRDSVELRFTFQQGALTSITMDSYREAQRRTAGKARAAEQP